VLYDASGLQLLTGALENIAAWSIRQGIQVRAMRDAVFDCQSSTAAHLAEKIDGICIVVVITP
jgi:Ni,Fe-hydrogenase III large subunit